MEEFFSNMGTWITALSPWMIFSLVLLIVMAYIFKTPLSDKITKFRFKDLMFWKSVKEVKEVEDFLSLKNHDLFTTTQSIKEGMRFIKFYTNKELDNTKTQMCIDFTNFKCDEINTTFINFLDTPRLDTMSIDELKHLMFENIILCSRTYTQKTKQHWMDKGIPKDDVDYVIEIFDKYRHSIISAFTSRVNSIFSSSFHSTNFERVLGCFEVFTMSVDLLPRDMKSTFEDLNGKFKNIKY
jgi:hypothetical protein